MNIEEKNLCCNKIRLQLVATISDSSQKKKKSSFSASLDATQKINWYSIPINIVCQLLTSTLYYYNEDGRRTKKE